MQIRNIFTDDRAVSPVIGVILMVAITVILAAVIGTFVLGLGDSLQDTSPQASFSGDQGTETYTTSTDPWDATTLTITHDGGDSVDYSNIEVSVNGDAALGADESGAAAAPELLWDGTGTVTAGSSVTVVASTTDAGNITGTYNYTSGTDTLTQDGDSAPVSQLSADDTVRVVWTSSDGSSTQTLFSRDIN